jgi:cytochrome P450
MDDILTGGAPATKLTGMPVRPTSRRAPHRRGAPLVGSTLAYFRDPLRMMRRQYDACGPVSEMNFVGGRSTVLLGPDACGAALQNKDKAFANAPGWGELVGPFFDRGLMLLDFEEHHRHRMMMQQAFTRQRLATYTAAMGPAVAALLDAWQPDPQFHVYPALKALTLDLATQVFMGGADLAAPDELDRVSAAFVACVQAATGFVRSSRSSSAGTSRPSVTTTGTTCSPSCARCATRRGRG